LLSVAVASTLAAGLGAAQAQAQSGMPEIEVSGNVALTSDYKFRGISQSDEDIAIQGGFDLGLDNGLYIGTWGSSVDFDTNGPGLDGSLELDLYAGWSGDIGENMSIDVGVLYYDYPGDDDELEGDYLEFYASYSIYDLSLGIAYSDDYYAESGEFVYLSAGYSLPLSEVFTADFHVGYNTFEEEIFLSDGADDYVDYSVGVTASWLALDWTLAWVGTNLDDEEVFDTDWGDDQLVFTIAKSL